MVSKSASWLPSAAFALCTLVWGSTWLAIKLGNETLPSLNGAGLRFLIASAVLLSTAAAFRIPPPRGAVQWRLVGFVGIVLIGIDYGLIYWAEESLATGLTSVLFAVMPLFTLALAASVGLEAITPPKLAGILVAVSGVVLLSWDSLGLDAASLAPVAAVLGAAFCSAATTVATKRWGAGLHPVALNAWSMAIGTLALYAAALARGEGLRAPATAGGWAAVVYLAILGSIVAFLLYFWLLRRWDATRCGLVSVLTPILAVALGAIVRGERLTIHLAAGSALVLSGVFLAMRPGRVLTPAPSTGAGTR